MILLALNPIPFLVVHLVCHQGKYKLEFWVYVGVAGWEGTAAKVPDVQISIRGTKGQCNIIKIYDVKPDAFEPVCQ